MLRLLNRMVSDKLIKRVKIHQNAPLFFQLPKVKAYNIHTYQHEQMAGDLYVAYQTSGQLRFWGYGEEDEVKPDRSSVIGGQIIFWEVDRGTEHLDVIRYKVQKYIELSQRKPKFNVIFTASKGRAKSILTEVLLPIRSKVWFFASEFQAVLKDPLGPVLVSPVAPDKFTSLWSSDGQPDSTS